MLHIIVSPYGVTRNDSPPSVLHILASPYGGAFKTLPHGVYAAGVCLGLRGRGNLKNPICSLNDRVRH